MPTAMAAPHPTKPALRVMMRERRAACDPAWGVRLAGHALAAFRPGQVIGGFWPMRGEIDIRPLLLALAGRGHVLGLPRTPALGAALDFHRFRPGMTLLAGLFGTSHPPDDLVTPDVLLVPLLAFDRKGQRLGYGGGYYDRTLALWPGARAIGCGFACQAVDRVPAEAHDRRLDAVATEDGLFFVE